MGNGPAPYSEIGKRAREDLYTLNSWSSEEWHAPPEHFDLLNRDYNYDQKISISIPSATGMGITASGIKKNDIFVGDISTQYKSGNTTVDVKVDTYSNISTRVTLNDVISSTKAAFSFNIPDHKSGKLEVQYLHPHAALNSSIGLNPFPLVELSGTLGTKDFALGGEIIFDAASSSFTKYNAGISFNQPDFTAAVILTDKGQTLKASYVHSVNPLSGTEVAAEMTHRFSNYENSFSIGSSHMVDPRTVVKTRLSHNGEVAMLCQREWRPKSHVTLSAEYDPKATHRSPKLGVALALKP